MQEDQNIILEERRSKLLHFMREKRDLLYYLGLAVVVWFGALYIRTRNIPYLKDITTGGWTLAPDLDPFLFLRWAKYVVAHGSLMAVDTMRYVPIGFKTTNEMPVVTYAIVYVYKILHAFSSKVTVEYAAIVSPVIFFVFTLIAFFFFVKQLFIKSKNANLIALISTAFLAVIPGFLHRTMAGVPEKEAHAFVFMFLAFYFILKAWNSEDWKKSAVFGVLAGIATGITGLAWGGATFIFVAVGLSAFISFFASHMRKRHILSYVLWVFSFTLLLAPFPRFGLKSLLTSTTSGFAWFVCALFILHEIISYPRISELLRIDRLKIPKKVSSLIILVILGFVSVLILYPSFISSFFGDLFSNLLKPFEFNRLTVTVAENNRTFFDSWSASFGLFFWVFFFGSILLFYETMKSHGHRTKLKFVLAYVVLICGVIFTRISSSSVMNGDNLISNFLFLGSMIIFGGFLTYEYFKKQDWDLDHNLIFLLATYFFTLLTARGSIRLLYFMYPIAPIIGAFTIVKLSEMYFEYKEETIKILFGVLAVVSIFLSAYSLYQFSSQSLNEARYAEVPSSYNIQWQLAMNWTRNNTPEDAVFSHWWDYGYWVQAMGERATFLDGGNEIVYWDYLMGKTLTARNETEMLEVLKTHNVSYLLIDSTDIGKYTAFSSIGSDENYDRYSWIPTYSLNDQNIVEKKNETDYLFTGGTRLDDDLVYGNQIFVKENSGIGGFILPIKKGDNSSFGSIEQPSAIVISNGKQTQVPINCVYLGGKILFNTKGIDGCLYILPQITSQKVMPIGGALWLGPRLMRSEFSKLYLFDETQNFELVHSENYPIIDELNNNYKLNLPEFVLYQGNVLGPIKIWKINYPSDIVENPEYLRRDYPNPALSKVGNK